MSTHITIVVFQSHVIQYIMRQNDILKEEKSIKILQKLLASFLGVWSFFDNSKFTSRSRKSTDISC